MDRHILNALVERWRPETHTFHFPTGECTITLEDVFMLLGLNVSGYVVTGVKSIERPLYDDFLGLKFHCEIKKRVNMLYQCHI